MEWVALGEGPGILEAGSLEDAEIADRRPAMVEQGRTDQYGSTSFATRLHPGTMRRPVGVADGVLTWMM